MLAVMNKLKEIDGLSRVETICLVGISCIGAALLVALGAYLLELMHEGNDANTLNTATSIASSQAHNACLVPHCTGQSDSSHVSHLDSQGRAVAYYDKTTNSLVATKPSGYNESSHLTIDGMQTIVQASTFTIVAIQESGDITCSWVEGA